MAEPPRFSLFSELKRRASSRWRSCKYDTDDMILHAWPDAIDLWRDPRFVALFARQD